MQPIIRIGVLISGGGSNLQAIIDACESHSINAVVTFVGSDTPEAAGLSRAVKHGIPDFVVDYSRIIQQFHRYALPNDFNLQECLNKQHIFPGNTPVARIEAFLKSRAIAESELLTRIRIFDFDLLVLAGFMRNLTPYLIDRINVRTETPRIMNIHPAILPAFPGTDGYGDTFRYGCKVGGCTVHFVDYGEDSGPIIGQRTFPIMPDDTIETVRLKGLEQEWHLYPECIQMFAEGRLQVLPETFILPSGATITRTIVKIAPNPPGGER